MKSQFKPMITLSSLVFGLSFAQAQTKYKNAAEVMNLRHQLVSSTPVAQSPVSDLSMILKKNFKDDDDSLTSSFFIKQILSTKASAFINGIKGGHLVLIDPSLSLPQYDAKVKQSEGELLIQSINQKKATANSKSEMEQVVTDLMFNHALKQRKAEKEVKNIPLTEDEQQVIAKLNEHLQKAPKNNKGQSLKEILGDFHDFGIHNGRIRYLTFSSEQNLALSSHAVPNTKKYDLSLSNLISLKTGDDRFFVLIHQYLVNYLKEQKQFFDQRSEAIDGHQGLVASDMVIASAELFKNNNLRIGEKTLGPTKWEQLSGSQKYAARLQYFLEGHPGYTDLATEKKALNQRSAMNGVVIQYLEGRMVGAARVNNLSSALSAAQMNFLIDLFLQLNQDRLPTDALVDQAQTKAMQDEKGILDFVYLRQLNRDLISLQQYMDENESKERAKQIDLKTLR